MQTKIAKIGDEFGLLLPKHLLDACGFGTDATVTVQDKMLIVRPSTRRPREGWAEAIAAIPEDALLRDFEQLKSFREMADEGDSGERKWPAAPSDETV
jgi:antitoxin component of MazEF toxin-antitoxin module